MNQSDIKLKAAVQHAIDSSLIGGKKIKGLHLLGLSLKETQQLEKELRAPYLDTIDIELFYCDEDEEVVDHKLHVGLDIFSHRSKEIQDFDNLFERVKEIISTYVNNDVTLDFHMSRNS